MTTSITHVTIKTLHVTTSGDAWLIVAAIATAFAALVTAWMAKATRNMATSTDKSAKATTRDADATETAAKATAESAAAAALAAQAAVAQAEASRQLLIEMARDRDLQYTPVVQLRAIWDTASDFIDDTLVTVRNSGSGPAIGVTLFWRNRDGWHQRFRSLNLRGNGDAWEPLQLLGRVKEFPNGLLDRDSTVDPRGAMFFRDVLDKRYRVLLEERGQSLHVCPVETYPHNDNGPAWTRSGSVWPSDD